MTRDYTHLPTAWDQLQPNAETYKTADPAERDQANSNQENARASIHGQDNSVEANPNAAHSGNNPSPPQALKGAWEFLRDEGHSRACQTVLGFLVFLMTLAIALIYKGQLGQMIESNQINRESLTSVQRAFVSFQRFEYFRLQDPDHSNVHNWDILADFDNNGATSAIDVIGILQVQELPAEPTDEQFRGPYTHFPTISIPPKSTRAVRIPRPIPEPLIFGVDLGPVITIKSPTQTHFNRHLFVWSWIYYRDVFRETESHVTEFCNQLTGINLLTQNYNPSASPWAPGNLNFTYAGCSNHNCDDKQCKDYATIVKLAEKP